MNAAAIALVREISFISEDQWAAGWLEGVEHELFGLVFLDRPDGLFSLTDRERSHLRELALQAGGWPRYLERGECDPEKLAEHDEGGHAFDSIEMVELWHRIEPFEWFEARLMEESL